jgi:hypothetical protein
MISATLRGGSVHLEVQLSSLETNGAVVSVVRDQIVPASWSEFSRGCAVQIEVLLNASPVVVNGRVCWSNAAYGEDLLLLIGFEGLGDGEFRTIATWVQRA